MPHAAPPLLDMIAGLIATPSISSVRPALDQSNRPLLALLGGWLADAGFRVELLDIPGHPDKANLVATLGAGPGGLVLAGHVDTVPCDPARWHHDPFRLTEADGRLYGLGTTDMKAFLALAIEAARGLTAAALHRPLVILATADEESAMHGAHALLAAGRSFGRHAVIGEPTSLKPVRMHKGVMGEAVRLVGRSGHASDPALGNNALEGMHEVLTAVLAWREELQQRHRHPAFPLPVPTINPGYIHGGDNPNRICGACELHLDLRLLPGMDPDALRAELTRRVAEVAGRRGLSYAVEALFPSVPPTETAATAPIVRAAEALTGHPAEAVSFGTEAPWFNQLGMQTLVLGPGDIAVAHQPDEYLALARLTPTVDLLRALIRQFCLSPTTAP